VMERANGVGPRVVKPNWDGKVWNIG
jgi:hypothetical protein